MQIRQNKNIFISKINKLPFSTKYGSVGPFSVNPIHTIIDIGFFITPYNPKHFKINFIIAFKIYFLIFYLLSDQPLYENKHKRDDFVY